MSPGFADALATAIASHAPLPAFARELTLDDAYRLQHEVTRARTGGATGGIKAGVTAPPMQSFLGIDHALIASLYADSRYENRCRIPYVEGRRLECELAIVVDGQGRPAAIAPAIEIVLVQFSRPADFSAANLLACNLGADAYIVGDPIPWDPSFNEAKVVLSRGGEVLNQAEMSDALGGPESASAWMWNEARRCGFECSEGTLLLGGACGTVVSSEEGQYRADFGDLGAVEFEVGS